ncbi:DENN domain-containing protein 10-like [Sycon ciliatum]|uniref:DENN domain-containing protein 10-like n=1 Tax=Sycon ciliatum TaxID=27933 RepID=UPI0020ADDD84|eukprot:scpid27067/ scgid11922/ Protein FAM45A; Protein FAM45
MSAGPNNLLAASLVEKDKNGDTLWTWTYPSVDEGLRELLLRKTCLAEKDSNEIVPFSFGHFGRMWYYVLTVAAGDSEPLAQVTHFTVIVHAKDFNPEKYQHLASILAETYRTTGNAARLLENYLSVVTRGVCSGVGDIEDFAVKSYDVRKAYIASSIKDVIQQLGIEAILVYTALLLKKRVAVYHPDIQQLLNIVRALPTLVWHRQNWSIVYPHVHLVEDELEDLASTSSYVAGFTDSSVESHANLYDVFVNVAGGAITVAPHAKEAFGMGKIHKDIATRMVQCSEDEDMTDQAMIKEIALKTKDLINNLKSLAVEDEETGEPVVTPDALRGRKLTPAMENFLYHLASAEGLVKF